ncbi:MAG: hypothetical protein KDA96_11805, partial [Planctomycetaceae bacterium]|nr:hypothetical protein [Planctomycetaceae bacterium]
MKTLLPPPNHRLMAITGTTSSVRSRQDHCTRCAPCRIPACLLAVLLCLLSGGSTVAAPVQDVDADSAVLSSEHYIPVDQLDALLNRDGRGVLMPRAQFMELLQKANTAQKQQQGHPASILATSAQVHVEPLDQLARVRLSIHVRQFRDGWSILRLPIGSLSAESTDIPGRDDVVIARDPEDRSVLMIASEQAGEFVVHLSLSAVMGSVGNDRTVAFQLPQVPATQVTVQCPSSLHLLVNDLKLQRPAETDQATVYEIPVGAVNELRLRWTARHDQADSQSLVFVGTDAQVVVQKEVLRWKSESLVSVFGQSINRLQFRVPGRMEITTVESVGLESWTLEDDPEHAGFTRATLTWRQPFTRDRVVTVTAVAAVTGEETQAVPSLIYEGVTSHSGRLLITHEQDLRLASEASGGIRPVAGSAGDRVSAFDFWQQEFNLKVALKSRDRELFSESVSTLGIQETTAELQASFKIETLNAPLFEFPLQLPPDWQLMTLSIDGTVADWRAGSEANQIIAKPQRTVPEGEVVSVTVALLRTIPAPDTEQSLDLPVVKVAGATSVGGTYTLNYPDDLVVSPVELVGLESVVNRESPGGMGAMEFRNPGTDISGRLSITRKVVRLASRSELRVWADLRQQTVDAMVTVDVLDGRTRNLTLLLPEELGTDVRFTVASVSAVPGMEQFQQNVQPVKIIEQTPGDPVDGYRPFTLRLDDRFAGSVAIHAVVQKSREAGAPIAAPSVRVAGAVRQHGLVVFEAYPEQQLSTDNEVSTISGLFAADAELVGPPPEGSGRRIVQVWRFVQPDYAFQVQETRFDITAVPSAVCQEVSNVSRIDEQGSVQRYCRIHFRASGVQTLRFRLPDPEHSFLWSTILNDEPVEVRSDNGEQLVALRDQSGEADQVLEILFETPAAVSDFGAVTQDPIFLSVDAAGDGSIPLEVLKQEWDVRYPPSSLLVASDGYFHPVSGMDQPGWVRSLFVLQLPKPNTLIQRLVSIVFVLFVLFVLGLLIARRRWVLLGTVILVGAVGMALLLPLSIVRSKSESLSQSADMGATMEPMASAVPESDDLARAVTPMDFDGAMEGGAYGGGFGGFDGGGLGGAGMAPGGMGMAPADKSGEATSRPQLEESVPGDAYVGFDGAARGTGQLNFNGLVAGLQSNGGQQSNGQVAIPDAPTALGLMDGAAAFETLDNAPVRGKARLSVRVHLDVPDDYQSRTFRSIGDSIQAPSSLSLVIQR